MLPLNTPEELYRMLAIQTPELFYPKPLSAECYAERFPGLHPLTFELLEAAGPAVKTPSTVETEHTAPDDTKKQAN